MTQPRTHKPPKNRSASISAPVGRTLRRGQKVRIERNETRYPPKGNWAQFRGRIDNIGLIVAVFDAHDPGVYKDGTHACPCGWTGTETEWHTHLADAIALKLSTVELPEVNPDD